MTTATAPAKPGSVRQIARGTAVLAGARVVERGSNLVIALLVSRQLGASALGTYATAVAYFQLIAMAGEMGTSNLLVREIAKEPTRTMRYVVHAAVMAIGVSLVVMTLAWTVIPHLGYSAELRRGLMVMVIAILPGAWNTVAEAAFIANQRVELETYTTVGATLTMIAGSIAVLAAHGDVVALLGVFAAVETGIALVYVLLIHRCIAPIRIELDRRFARGLLHDIRPFAGSSVLGALFSRPEIIVLSLLATERQVGHYAAALKLVDVWQLVPQVLMANVFPVLARSHHTGDGNAVRVRQGAATALLTMGLPVGVGLAITAGPLVHAIYGEAFQPTVLLLRILAASAVLYATHSVLWRSLAARGDQAAVLHIQVFSVVVRLVVGVALVARFGALGAAITVPTTLLVHNALLARQLRKDGCGILQWRDLRPAVLAAAGMAAVLVVLGDAPVPVLVAAGVAVYGGLLAAISIAVGAIDPRRAS
jgi:O-antigen/teichoic acid export membrane protein